MIRFGLALAAALSVAALAACGDPIRIRAQFETVQDTVTVFAVTGTPVIAPAALSTIRHEAVRIETTRDFDIVFDINQAGEVVLYPVQLVGGSQGTTGIQKASQSFDDILEAPRDGYVTDSATIVTVGEVVLIEAQPVACAGTINPWIYSKLVVDEIDVATRSVVVRMVVDPNCGFRSLDEGIPER